MPTTWGAMSKLSVQYGFMPYPAVPSTHAATGPLSGLTFAVKDLIDVRGYPTSGGQAMILAKSGIKETTAPTVQKLLDSVAELVGKAITEELAFSIVGSNAHFGAPINSANPDRYTGGSSSGSAAVVAAGLGGYRDWVLTPVDPYVRQRVTADSSAFGPPMVESV